MIKIEGRENPGGINNQIEMEDDADTEIGGIDDMQIEEPIRKYSSMSKKSNLSKKMGEDDDEKKEEELDKLEILISKKNRE